MFVVVGGDIGFSFVSEDVSMACRNLRKIAFFLLQNERVKRVFHGYTESPVLTLYLRGFNSVGKPPWRTS